MRKSFYILSALLLSCGVAEVSWAATTTTTSLVDDNELVASEAKAKTIEQKVAALLSKMTIQEKIGQISQPVLYFEDLAQLKDSIRMGGVGSFCCIRRSELTPEECNEIQRIAVEESRLGIPVIMGFDVIHGFKTIFPVVLGSAASWDENLIETSAKVAASEARSYGMHLAFSPMVDVARDPRWGRIAEGYGEDVVMNQRMGAAVVRGYQQGDISSPTSIGSCVKHFVGYGMSLGGRDKQFTEISDNTLLNVYLPPFEACVNAGAVSVMSAFNDISGTPASANHFTETEILRDKWGFKGFVLSDWDAIVELIDHGVVGDEKSAAAAAFNAGTDIEMKSSTFSYMEELINEGKVSIDKLDDAVSRILTIKYRLGLFDNPYVDVKKGYESQQTAENREVARTAAAQSMILLKNNNSALPLSSRDAKVVVTGKFAHSTDLYGHWKGMNTSGDAVTAFKGLKDNEPSGIEIIDGTKVSEDGTTAIVCIGEPSSRFGESNDVMDITISQTDIDAVKEAKAKYEKVVAVVFCGRPMVLTPISEVADAILIAWHSGTETGNALADIVYGTVNPSGKTTTTFLRETGQTPTFYSDRNSGRPREDNYSDGDVEPLYPFGYGLSYTKFEYKNFAISDSTMAADGMITVSVNVRNSGKCDGAEVVQLYTHDIVASITRPQMELKDFKKIYLKKGESKTVYFTLKAEQLAFYNRKLEKVVEPGEFDLWVGGSSVNTLHKNFTVK